MRLEGENVSHEEKEEELILCVLGLCMLGLCMLDARFSWCISLVRWRVVIWPCVFFAVCVLCA